MKKINLPGFTLLEVMLTIAIFAVLSTAGFSVYKSFQNKNGLESANRITLQSLREAETMSRLGNNDSLWGVKSLSNKIIVFSGDAYVSRDIAKDKIFDLPIGSGLSGIDELLFFKLTGLPQNPLTITVTYGGESKQINISSQGVFSN